MPNFLNNIVRWFDSGNISVNDPPENKKIDLLRILPFILLHLSCFTVILVGYSTTALMTAVILYFLRMFAITAFYHRYFSHRTFKTSRVCQFIFAILGASAAQRGPIWWASHHRHHHRYTDQVIDQHSPKQHGFWWSHMGWFLTRRNFRTQHATTHDLMRFPELVFLDRFDILVPSLLATLLFVTGYLLAMYFPALGTNGLQLLVWGFCISTIVTMHGTFMINSLAHHFGSRRYATNDESRNNFFLALLTLGEGWHNNHHHFPSSAKQGFYWWEIDITYYLLQLLEKFGIIWDLRVIPDKFRARHINKTTD